MYRYSVDNSITYTSEDLVLFRESPFACWMERLTLENPDHGIAPDAGSEAPATTMQRQTDIARTLRAEGKDVLVVDWELAESERRQATLQAMRRGVDFIVDGQLALGPLASTANLLMRTSGYSDLGNYLYVPCDTQGKTTVHSAFRLCFLADLLHSLQGQLPPQMLIIRGGADVLPLQTDDHIHYYLAVKLRFMTSMRDFRKHRMPDPAASPLFGRWSECASEVLKQRARAQQRDEPEGADYVYADPSSPDEPIRHDPAQPGAPVATPSPALTGTLAEQARQLAAGVHRETRADSAAATVSSGSWSALDNLEFIGSNRLHTVGQMADAQPRLAVEEDAGKAVSAPPETGKPIDVDKAHPLDSAGIAPDVGRTPAGLEPAPPAVLQLSESLNEVQADQAPDKTAIDPVPSPQTESVPFSSNLITSETIYDLGTDPLRQG